MPMGTTSDVVAASTELNTRHILRALSETKLTRNEEIGLQDSIENMLDEIDSSLISQIRAQGKKKAKIKVQRDGKEVEIWPDDYLDGRFHFICSEIRGFKPNPRDGLTSLFEEVCDDYTFAQHAAVPKENYYRIEAMLIAFQKLKGLHVRMKVNYEHTRGNFMLFMQQLIALMSARGMEVLEYSMGDLIYNPDNFEQFAKGYLKGFAPKSDKNRKGEPS